MDPSRSSAVPLLTYLLVDGENIDATLGNSVLGGRPSPEQRPRWDRIRDFAQRTFGRGVKGLFFLNASHGQLPMGFVQALLALEYRPIPLSGGPDEKVVDIAIQRTLQALAPRADNVLLASHDGDFVGEMAGLLRPGRRTGLIGFREFVNARFRELEPQGLEIFDLEEDARCFNVALPRVRIIPIAEFDPLRFL